MRLRGSSLLPASKKLPHSGAEAKRDNLFLISMFARRSGGKTCRRKVCRFHRPSKHRDPRDFMSLGIADCVRGHIVGLVPHGDWSRQKTRADPLSFLSGSVGVWLLGSRAPAQEWHTKGGAHGPSHENSQQAQRRLRVNRHHFWSAGRCAPHAGTHPNANWLCC